MINYHYWDDHSFIISEHINKNIKNIHKNLLFLGRSLWFQMCNTEHKTGIFNWCLCFLRLFLVIQSFLTLCDPLDYSTQALLSTGLSGKDTGMGCHFLFRGSSWPKDWTFVSCVSCIGGRFFIYWAIGEAQIFVIVSFKWNCDFLIPCFYISNGQRCAKKESKSL